jgi:hypothetical protein
MALNCSAVSWTRNPAIEGLRMDRYTEEQDLYTSTAQQLVTDLWGSVDSNAGEDTARNGLIRKLITQTDRFGMCRW